MMGPRQADQADREGDVYFCPVGKMLTTKGTLVNDGATLLYRALDAEAMIDKGAMKATSFRL